MSFLVIEFRNVAIHERMLHALRPYMQKIKPKQLQKLIIRKEFIEDKLEFEEKTYHARIQAQCTNNTGKRKNSSKEG